LLALGKEKKEWQSMAQRSGSCSRGERWPKLYGHLRGEKLFGYMARGI